MKTILLAAALGSIATASYSDQRVDAKVKDHYTTVYNTVEEIDRRCEMIDVPVYGTRTRGGDAAGGALLGMIIGGVTGKVISGNDKGAAGGAVIGGLIGADKGSKPKSERYIKGYRREKSCTDEVTYVDKPKNVYSHSTLRFTLNGKRYKIDFSR